MLSLSRASMDKNLESLLKRYGHVVDNRLPWFTPSVGAWLLAEPVDYQERVKDGKPNNYYVMVAHKPAPCVLDSEPVEVTEGERFHLGESAALRPLGDHINGGPVLLVWRGKEPISGGRSVWKVEIRLPQ